MPTTELATLEVLQRHLQHHPADRAARAVLADLLDDAGEEFMASVHRHLAWGTMEKSATLEVLQRHLQRCPADRAARAVLADLLDDAGERFMASVHRHLAWKTEKQMAGQRYLTLTYGTATGVAVYKPGAGSLPGETEIVDWGRFEVVQNVEVVNDHWFRLHTLGKALPQDQDVSVPRIWYVPNDQSQKWTIWTERDGETSRDWLNVDSPYPTRRIPVFSSFEEIQMKSHSGK